jgi:hypothetical protein
MNDVENRKVLDLDVFTHMVELAAGEDSSDTECDYEDANLVGMSAGVLSSSLGQLSRHQLA